MTAETSIAGQEHWTQKGDVRLFLWEKRAGAQLLESARPGLPGRMREIGMIRTARAVCCVLVILMLVASATVSAQAPDPVDMAAAKREGGVSWYTSTPVAQAQKIANLFQAETGIKVELFRSGGSAVLRRFLQEIDGRRVLADVLTISDPAAVSMLIKRDLLVPFRPRNFEKIPDDVKDARGYHVAQRLNVAGIVARTDKGLELPKNWTDLVDPKYKGKLVMPDPSFTAIQLLVVGALSQKYGWGFYQKLRANEIMIVQSHQQVSDTIVRGERLPVGQRVHVRLDGERCTVFYD